MAIKQIPILFSESMVQAILDGRKTQTRRVLKGIALDWLDSGFTPEFVAHPENGLCRYGYAGDQLWVRETFYAYGEWVKNGSTKSGGAKWRFNDLTGTDFQYRYLDNHPSRIQKTRGGIGWYKRPSLFMPRAASRITLEVTANRIEQLQDISEADAIAEGIYCYGEPAPGLFSYKNYTLPESEDIGIIEAQSSYETLWQSINGPDSWDQNPYVTVTSFRLI